MLDAIQATALPITLGPAWDQHRYNSYIPGGLVIQHITLTIFKSLAQHEVCTDRKRHWNSSYSNKVLATMMVEISFHP